MTLTISTTASATAGTVPITINGSVTNGPTKTQSLSLTITLDYSLVISNPSLQAYVNSTVNFNGTLTSLNGYSSAVNVSCGTGCASNLLSRAGKRGTDPERRAVHCDGGQRCMRHI